MEAGRLVQPYRRADPGGKPFVTCMIRGKPSSITCRSHLHTARPNLTTQISRILPLIPRNPRYISTNHLSNETSKSFQHPRKKSPDVHPASQVPSLAQNPPPNHHAGTPTFLNRQFSILPSITAAHPRFTVRAVQRHRSGLSWLHDETQVLVLRRRKVLKEELEEKNLCET